MFGNRVSLHLDQLAPPNPFGSPCPNPVLQLLDIRLMHLHRASTHCHMVRLGEYPGIEVGGDIIPHIHLGPVFVIGHLVFRDADALLKGHGVVVVSGVDGLSHLRVKAICSHNQIYF